MVFRAPDGVSPADRIVLQVWSRKDFKLLTSFIYVPPTGDPVTVPAHDQDDVTDTTDLASVPPLLWGLLASYGRQLRAALVHDHLCVVANRLLAAGDRAQAHAVRHRADQLFRLAMRDGGTGADPAQRVPWLRATLFWAGVSLGRYWKFRKVRALLMTVQVLVAVVATHVVLHTLPKSWFAALDPSGLGDHTLGYVVVVAVLLLLTAAWGRDFGIPLVGILVGPVVLPVLLLTLIVQTALWLPDLVISWLPNQPPPAFGPTLNRP